MHSLDNICITILRHRTKVIQNATEKKSGMLSTLEGDVSRITDSMPSMVSLKKNTKKNFTKENLN